MNEVWTSFIKGGIAALWAAFTGGGSETVIRAGMCAILRDFTANLPREVGESFVSRATLAFIEAKSEAHAELEITAVIAAIQDWVKKNA
jgi:hypothetical protein